MGKLKRGEMEERKERKTLTYQGRMELRQKRSELLQLRLTMKSCARIGCKTPFKRKHKNHHYCSSECERLAWEMNEKDA